jgi:hypothetical protein
MSFGKKADMAWHALKEKGKLPPGLRPVAIPRRMIDELLKLDHDLRHAHAMP